MFNSVYQNRYEHLRDIIERQGGQSAIATKLDVSKQYINLIGSEKSKKTIGNAMARKIETVFGLPVGTIDQQLGSKRTEIEEHTVKVPLLNAVVSLGASAARSWENEAAHSITLSKRWLRHNTEASSFSALAVLTAPGDSMAPTFGDGAILLVDTSITQIKADAVYVLRQGDELFVKRVQRNLDGSLDILSDNPAYRPQSIQSPQDSGLLVLGRVLLALTVSKL